MEERFHGLAYNNMNTKAAYTHPCQYLVSSFTFDRTNTVHAQGRRFRHTGGLTDLP